MATSIKKIKPSAKIFKCPLADGGDGTLDVLLTRFSGRKRSKQVRGPLGKSVSAQWGLITLPKTKKKVALIEMARASGLVLVKKKNRIMEASSYGTGQLIKAALDQKCKEIWMGVGGTATSDGGAGALEALGLRYFDKKGKKISGDPKNLKNLFRIDWRCLDRRIKTTKIIVLCDVRNPLLGPRGSARMFGPQKGATPSQVRELETFLKQWSLLSRRNTKKAPGAGAAGGMAFGLSGFLSAHLTQGAEFIIKVTNWKKYQKSSDVILTGEGTIDKTSFQGKILGLVAKNRGRKPLYGICGFTTLTRPQYQKKGFNTLFTMGKKGLSQPRSQLIKSSIKVAQIL